MTVRELIACLSAYPPEAEVFVTDFSDDWREPATTYDRGPGVNDCDHLCIFIDARPIKLDDLPLNPEHTTARGA